MTKSNSFFSVFDDTSIRFRILLACLATFIPFAIATVWFSYSVMRDSLERQITSELGNSTEMLRNMVETSVQISIRSYLRSVADTNLDVVRDIYHRVETGELSEEGAKREAARVILSQKIGQTGYLYCVTTKGVAPVHPDKGVEGKSFLGVDFVEEQIRLKDGYLEYEWKNPGEASPRPKALFMRYFEPWDWIISATTYREEFAILVNVEDFQRSVADLKFGPSGYSFVLDLEANLIIHPIFQGQNAFDVDSEGEKDFIREMVEERKGRISYFWKNPGEVRPREKIVVYDYVPEVDWIVASSAYMDDLYKPLGVIRDRVAAVALLCLFMAVLIALRISVSITQPIRSLAKRLAVDGRDNPAFERKVESNDEVRQLSAYFDRFMERLERESAQRRGAEARLRTSQERYRALVEATPDPIMVVGLDGHTTYLNPTFSTVFGWRLADFKGVRIRNFVPSSEIGRVQDMIRQLLRGMTISGEGTVFLTKEGDSRYVNISGGPFFDADGELTGAVVILRDVTEFKRFERIIIETDEHERIRIGQDLHDDLVPHLIGVDVMCKVLLKRLSEGSPDAFNQAEKVHDVLTEAIRKTRGISRGLAPVHLVEEGLEMGLRQMIDFVETIFSVPCNFAWEGSIALDATTAMHVYRIVQEAVHNAVKHADASIINVKCKASPEEVQIEVTDDGSGYSATAQRQGMGLKIMSYRAQIIGATVEAGPIDNDGDDDGGFLVRLTVRNGLEVAGDNGRLASVEAGV